jgi:hypothetical protein
MKSGRDLFSNLGGPPKLSKSSVYFTPNVEAVNYARKEIEVTSINGKAATPISEKYSSIAPRNLFGGKRLESEMGNESPFSNYS